MESLPLVRPSSAFSFPSQNAIFDSKTLQKNPKISTFCSPLRSQLTNAINRSSKSEYKPGVFDDFLLSYFRRKMVKEVGQDSEKPGYHGLMEVVNRLMAKGKSNLETEQAAVRVLLSLFPPFLVENFRKLIAPLGGGKIASLMVARVTAISCQWLMGPCSVNSVDLPNGSSCSSGVFIERCKYLEESKCVGICIHTCKLPTQTFFNDHMGVPLLMEPNFNDFSCQFNFGVRPPPTTEDKALQEPCLEICPNATQRRKLSRNVEQCPKSQMGTCCVAAAESRGLYQLIGTDGVCIFRLNGLSWSRCGPNEFNCDKPLT